MGAAAFFCGKEAVCPCRTGPPTPAHQGWITRYTDVPVDWEEIADYLRVGYRMVALKRMLTLTDAEHTDAD
jgi:hypothetical protein